MFALSPEEIALINPNTGTLPIFRNRRDADLTAAIYGASRCCGTRRSETATRGASSSSDLFDMTDDSDLFRTREKLER